MHRLEPVHLAAGAGEDRAALSGHPRKANAGQYAGAMPQPDRRQTRDASTQPETSCPFSRMYWWASSLPAPHQA
jgi:hypothetical protein